jgi:hypothetical protein
MIYGFYREFGVENRGIKGLRELKSAKKFYRLSCVWPLLDLLASIETQFPVIYYT